MISIEQIFLHVVESGSFRKAAENLNLEPSSVSRKVAALEKRLKVKLLRRSTQSTTPTELGRRYYEKLRHLIDEHAALEEEIRNGVEHISGRLKIAAPVDFGTRFVVPVIQNMQQQAAELSVELLMGSHFENLLEMGLDVAVRVGELSDSNMIAKKLGELDRVLVASPGYLTKHGTPSIVEQLEKHNFIMYSPGQARSDIRFADGCKYSHTLLKSNITVNSASAVRNLVLDGAGLHVGPYWLFKDDIDNGRVIQLLADKPLKSFPVHAVYPTRSYLPFKIKEFVRLLSEKLTADETSLR